MDRRALLFLWEHVPWDELLAANRLSRVVEERYVTEQVVKTGAEQAGYQQTGFGQTGKAANKW